MHGRDASVGMDFRNLDTLSKHLEIKMNVQPVGEQIRGIIIQGRVSESGMSESKRSNINDVDWQRGKERIIDQGQCEA